MDRRTFISGVAATGILAALPVAGEPAHDPRSVIWIANGDGWRQAHSLLAVKKGDIFCMVWPIRDKALSDGFIDLDDPRKSFNREYIYADSFWCGSPVSDPPYPWCASCKDPRVVPVTETRDAYPNRQVCNLCILDPGRAERKAEEARRYLRLHPPVNL